MSSGLDELRELIGGPQRRVTSWNSRYGDAPAPGSIASGAERILGQPGLERFGVSCAVEKIQLPDTEYDAEFRRDVDDEGLGGQFRT